MSKVAHYLQEHLIGEVMTGTDARRYFAHDASMFELPPALVAYPRNENDIRKTMRFTWQLAERGRVIPVTARGSGTDQTGAAIGGGIVLVFPAHMNRILELDTKGNTVTVEPGINYAKLQQTLHTYGRFLPPYPASIEYSTIGGAIANNATGEKSIKYGDTRDYVQALRVVLANGEVVETRRLNKREFSKKLGLATFEGEIYRSLDTLLEEQREIVDQLQTSAIRNNTGYALGTIKQDDGSFDLTPLFVGSQGTLGIVSEAIVGTDAHNPQTHLTMATFDSLTHLQDTVTELRALSDVPSILEVIDGHLLQQVHEQNPNQLKDIMPSPFPAFILLTEFDGGEKQVKKIEKKAHKIFERYATSLQTATEPEQQQQFWKLRQTTSTIIAQNQGHLRATTLIDGAAIPIERLKEYVDGVYKLLEASGVEPALWGQIGDGVIHLQPRFNLGGVGDRQKALKLMDEYYKFVISLNGSISGGGNDGRLRAPYVALQYGAEAYALLQKVKQIFDPYGTLNPGVKFGSSLEDNKAIIRADHTVNRLHDHLPRS